MNAATLSAQTHTLIAKQADCERELATAQRNLDLAQAELKSRAKNVSGGVKFYALKLETAQARLEQVTKAIVGRGPVVEWMLAS